MSPSKNPNRPQKGDHIKVEPIRKLKDIAAIKKILNDQPRDLALFTVGINTNLRASDLAALTVGQVKHLKAMEEIELVERKTGKRRRISLNKSAAEAIQALIQTLPIDIPNSAPLFASGRGGAALTVPSIHRLVKGWCRAINLPGNYGSHTLRKTWGYHQRVTFGSGIPELMVCFNHTTQKQTLDYLCVQPDEIRSLYANQL